MNALYEYVNRLGKKTVKIIKQISISYSIVKVNSLAVRGRKRHFLAVRGSILLLLAVIRCGIL